MLPAPPGGIAVGAKQGEEHLLGATLSAACSNAKGWVKTGICYQLGTLRKLAFVLEPCWHFPLKREDILPELKYT